MRPKDREQLFREGFDAYGAGDLERALAFYSPDVEATAPEWMNAGTVKSPEGFLEWARTWEEAWERWDQDLREVRAVGERHVVARVHVTGRGRGSGVELDTEVGHVADVGEDDKVAYYEIVLDFERALEIAHEREVSN